MPMPATFHKILIHGSEIIKAIKLPIGMLAEEAFEGRNKDYKKFRKYYRRNCNRTANLTDIFYHAMDFSDPIISSKDLNLRFEIRKKWHSLM
jgi:hypothetical protein